MDSKRLAEIADVMEGRGLTRVRVEEPDGSAIELERGVGALPAAAPVAGLAPVPVTVAAPAALEQRPTPAVQGEPGSADEAKAGTTQTASSALEVCSPMVGVFYAAPAPDDEPFVHVGSKVEAGQTLCIIEAMKLLNEVTAEADGEVVEICVADGDLVEYGSCIMRIA